MRLQSSNFYTGPHFLWLENYITGLGKIFLIIILENQATGSLGSFIFNLFNKEGSPVLNWYEVGLSRQSVVIFQLLPITGRKPLCANLPSMPSISCLFTGLTRVKLNRVWILCNIVSFCFFLYTIQELLCGTTHIYLSLQIFWLLKNRKYARIWKSFCFFTILGVK